MTSLQDTAGYISGDRNLPPREEAIARLNDLATLEDGWYDRNSDAPTAKSIEVARLVAEGLADSDLTRIGIFPRPDGGIVFEEMTRATRENALTMSFALTEIHQDGAITVYWLPMADNVHPTEQDFTDVEQALVAFRGALAREIDHA